MRIPSNIISYIHGISKGFVDENLSEEAMFFEDIWEAYEVELRKWIMKPLKRWRFKGSKIKHPKFLSVSGKTKPLDLDAPKIVDTLVNSIAQLALLKNHFTLEKIQDTIHSCGKKLSNDSCGEKSSVTLRTQVVEFFAPILFKDLQKMELIPISGKEDEKESEMDSHIGDEITFLIRQIDLSQEKYSEYRFIMFTDQDVKDKIGITLNGGKKLTEKWHSTLQGFYSRSTGEFDFILDFASEIFYYNGKELTTSTDVKAGYNYYKALAIILLYSKGNQITFEELYEIVTGEPYVKAARNTTQRWFTDLKNRLGVKKIELNRLFTSWKKYGYRVVKKDEPKFLLVLDKDMIQNILNNSVPP